MRLAARPLTRSVAAVLAVSMLAACGAGSPSPSPSPTVPVDLDTPAPSPVSVPTMAPTAPPTLPPQGDWPPGWDTAFCGAFEEIIVAQELAVDVGRALEEDERDDALALARELESAGAFTQEMLGELEEWEPAQDAVEQLTELMDLAERMGRNYRRYLDENSRNRLRRAQGFAADMGPVVENVEAELAGLANDENLSCPTGEFVLETP
jgi:hypothetical protein